MKTMQDQLIYRNPWEKLGWIYYKDMMYRAARDRFAEAVRRDPSREDLIENIQKLDDYADSTNTR